MSLARAAEQRVSRSFALMEFPPLAPILRKSNGSGVVLYMLMVAAGILLK